MTKPTQKINRTTNTWLIYLILAMYVYFLNAAGPISGYVKEEFQLSYTLNSIHFSAFAAGIVLVGLFGKNVMRRIGYWRAIGLACFGLGLGGALLAMGQNPTMTILGLFVMGCIGTFILALYPAILGEELGEGARVGISEANVIAAVVASLAPLAVGFFGARSTTWRMAVWIVVALSIGMGAWVSFFKERSHLVAPEAITPEPQKGRLPTRFWIIWGAFVSSIAIEFCSVYWGSDFLHNVIGLSQAQAAQAVSLFLIGMLIGRAIGGRLLLRISNAQILSASFLIGLAGFVLFWSHTNTLLSLLGLLLTGLGVANLYPVIISILFKEAGTQTSAAGAATTLASGIAILFLPFVLGAFADQIGIRLAYLIIGALFLIVAGLLAAASRRKPALLNE